MGNVVESCLVPELPNGRIWDLGKKVLEVEAPNTSSSCTTPYTPHFVFWGGDESGVCGEIGTNPNRLITSPLYIQVLRTVLQYQTSNMGIVHGMQDTAQVAISSTASDQCGLDSPLYFSSSISRHSSAPSSLVDYYQ